MKRHDYTSRMWMAMVGICLWIGCSAEGGAHGKAQVEATPNWGRMHKAERMDRTTPSKVDLTAFDVVVRPGESIQAAIEQAPEKPTEPFKIFIRKGTYHQYVNIDRPNIVLVGEDREETILIQTEEDEPQMGEGKRSRNGLVLQLQKEADDCVISGLTLYNHYDIARTPVEQPHQVPHRMTIRGAATRTIIINCHIWSDGNDALSLWASGSSGMYYHADLSLRCPGVDFICPRGWCYATRCQFYGDSRAMLWHDGRGGKSKKFVITHSSFDAKTPTLLGRYHHDAQFYLIHCKLSKNVLNGNIQYAYSDKVLDACSWGQRIYYYGCEREGGHSGWLNNNLHEAAQAPNVDDITAQWTFDEQWDPEKRIRELWSVLAY